MPFVSEQSINLFSCPTRGLPPGKPKVTITDNYALSCSYAPGSVNYPDTYFTDTTTVTGHGECLGANPDPTQIRCNPAMSTDIIKATKPSEVNKFFNKALDKTIATDTTCFFGDDHVDLHQCDGKACDAPFGPPPPPPPPPCSPPPADQQFTVDPNANPDCEPLIIDVEGHGFRLTDTANGVVFDIRADGHPLRIPWTANDSNAFLVLDRNGNGVIDDGSELFSNVSPQSASPHKNGFLALAEFDKPANGGNGDGVIDDHDAIFSQLRLWVDANHDGVSQPGELHKLHELGVYSISLDYGLSHRVDEFGNEFLYKARLNQGRPGESEVGRAVYDVFFVTK
jgi:hypothetical protein